MLQKQTEVIGKTQKNKKRDTPLKFFEFQQFYFCCNTFVALFLLLYFFHEQKLSAMQVIFFDECVF